MNKGWGRAEHLISSYTNFEFSHQCRKVDYQALTLFIFFLFLFFSPWFFFLLFSFFTSAFDQQTPLFGTIQRERFVYLKRRNFPLPSLSLSDRDTPFYSPIYSFPFYSYYNLVGLPPFSIATLTVWSAICHPFSLM